MNVYKDPALSEAVCMQPKINLVSDVPFTELAPCNLGDAVLKQCLNPMASVLCALHGKMFLRHRVQCQLEPNFYLLAHSRMHPL